MTAPWYVYIVETVDGKLYTGISTDPQRRLGEHAAGKKGARFFRTAAPRKIVYREPQSDRSAATRRETAIKKMSRRQKLELIATRDKV